MLSPFTITLLVSSFLKCYDMFHSRCSALGLWFLPCWSFHLIRDLPERGQVTPLAGVKLRTLCYEGLWEGAWTQPGAASKLKTKGRQRILPLKCRPHLTASKDTPSSSLPLPGVCLWEHSILGNNRRERGEEEEKSVQVGNEDIPLWKGVRNASL